MIYVFKNNEKIFPIEKMCKVLHQRSYYQWKSQSVSDRKTKDLLKKTSIYFESKQRYGSPRMTVELVLGSKVSRNYIYESTGFTK
jgi:hypothetical protein